MVGRRTVRGLAIVGIAALGVTVGALGTQASDQPAAAIGTQVGSQDWGRHGPGRGGMAHDVPWPDGAWGGSATTTATAELSAAARAAADEVTPSVVNVDTVVGYGTAEAAGTGIVISADGLVLTNHHVVEGSTAITATVVGTGTSYPATVVGYDSATDVAVLRLTGASDLPVADLGESTTVDVGELVVGLGNAGGVGGTPTSVEGVVTAVDQTITASDSMVGEASTLTDLIETDADIRSGQSGGPLVDASGEVIGMNVAAAMRYGSTDTTGYAIPIDDALAAAERILAGDGSDSVHIGGDAFLGVQLGNGWHSYGAGTTQATGVPVAGVVSGSAAAEAGLASGDQIIEVDGTATATAQQLADIIDGHNVGDRVTLMWVDPSGSPSTATVALGQGPVG